VEKQEIINRKSQGFFLKCAKMSLFSKKSPVNKTSSRNKSQSLQPGTANNLKATIFQGYKQLITKLGRESSRNKLIIENLQNHLEVMEGLDSSLSQMMQGFWSGYGPKIKKWLQHIKQLLEEVPGKIEELKKNMENCEVSSLKAKYQNLIDLQNEKENRWKNVGAMIISKVFALENINEEIEDIQNKKLVSTNSLDKMLQDYKAYEKDVRETLKDYRFLEDFESRVQQELDKAISNISPILLDLINNKIIENIKSIVPRAEFLLAEVSSIESVSKVVGSKVEELKSNQVKIIKAFQTLEVQSLEFKLKLEPFDEKTNLTQLETKFDEVINLLNSFKSQPQLSSSSGNLREGQKKCSFKRYREIVKEMGKSKAALEEIYPLLDNEANDFSGTQLKKVLHDFYWDWGIRNKISRHPRVKDKTLQSIIIIELRKRVEMPRFLALLMNFNRLVLHIIKNDQYSLVRKFPGLVDSSIYQNKTAFNCFQKYISRSKISPEVFNLISQSKKEKIICAVLKNPRLNPNYFIEYQYTENQNYINAMAVNVKTPAQVLNNILKKADWENRELILRHPNSTSFTKELIEKMRGHAGKDTKK
jgi:hypothetical protein